MLWLVAAVTVAATPAPEPKQTRPGTYVNARYGTRATYPSELFRVEREADNGDGITLRSRDGATLLIYAAQNPDRQQPRAYLNAQARLESGTVSYRHAGSNFAVMSGTEGGRIFYQRYVFDSRREVVHSYRLEYPRVLQRRYGPVVQRVTVRGDR